MWSGKQWRALWERLDYVFWKALAIFTVIIGISDGCFSHNLFLNGNTILPKVEDEAANYFYSGASRNIARPMKYTFPLSNRFGLCFCEVYLAKVDEMPMILSLLAEYRSVFGLKVPSGLYEIFSGIHISAMLSAE